MLYETVDCLRKLKKVEAEALFQLNFEFDAELNASDDDENEDDENEDDENGMNENDESDSQVHCKSF